MNVDVDNIISSNAFRGHNLAPKHANCLQTSSQTCPTSTHSKHAHELESTNASQLQTIAILKAQFDNLRAAHESHVEMLKRSHSVQVASLENQARLLKERMNKEGLQRSKYNSPFIIRSLPTETAYDCYFVILSNMGSSLYIRNITHAQSPMTKHI